MLKLKEPAECGLFHFQVVACDLSKKLVAPLRREVDWCIEGKAGVPGRVAPGNTTGPGTSSAREHNAGGLATFGDLDGSSIGSRQFPCRADSTYGKPEPKGM